MEERANRKRYQKNMIEDLALQKRKQSGKEMSQKRKEKIWWKSQFVIVSFSLFLLVIAFLCTRWRFVINSHYYTYFFCSNFKSYFLIQLHDSFPWFIILWTCDRFHLLTSHEKIWQILKPRMTTQTNKADLNAFKLHYVYIDKDCAEAILNFSFHNENSQFLYKITFISFKLPSKPNHQDFD